jgi:hypothetical protein
MTGTNASFLRTFTLALEAIRNLCRDAFVKLDSDAGIIGLAAHSEIKRTEVGQKQAVFLRHFLPLRAQMVVLFVDTYRRYFKLALSHPSQTGGDPHRWAWTQLQPALHAAFEWIREWYVLACEGENQSMRQLGSKEIVQSGTVSFSIPISVPPLPPVTSWRAPAWLFGISLEFFGVGALKLQHVPKTDSEERLGAAHTRLLLSGARSAFLGKLRAACQTAWNEETAAAGTLRAEPANWQKRSPNKRRGWQQRLKLYKVIQKILMTSPSPQGLEFCAELDKRHAPPLVDWTKSGKWREGLTWKEAWNQPQLRSRIRRVRQEAQRATPN